MSNVIDTRIVEMQFDNAAFEKGVAKTMTTIQNLNRIINTSAGALTLARSFTMPFRKLANAIPVDEIVKSTSTVASAIGDIFSKTFDAVSSVASVGLKSITALGAAVTGMAATGGMKRALNIEQAQFQLQGLMKDAYNWTEIQKVLDFGVKDTAYGLDSAARAASQLVASGVDMYDGMDHVLRGISGVAAMTNHEYDEVAHIFTTVAGNGRLMGMQLSQLSSYGLNAAATMRDYFNEINEGANYTEEEIRDMVSKGKISFQEFSDAMDWAYGEHAKEANKTFTGSMANTKAALSRIGANFATPFITNMVDVFNALKGFIDTFNKGMQPIYDSTSKGMERAKDAVVGFFKSFTEKEEVFDSDTGIPQKIDRTTDSINALRVIFGSLISMSNHVKSSLERAFDPELRHLRELMGFKETFEGSEFLQDIARNVLAIQKAFESLNLTKLFHWGLARPFGAIVDGVKEVSDVAIPAIMDHFVPAFNAISEVVQIGSLIFTNALRVWHRFIANGIQMAIPVLEDAGNLLVTVSKALFDFLYDDESDSIPIFESMLSFLDGFKDGFLNFYSFIRSMGSVAATFLPSMEDIKAGADLLGEAAIKIGNFFKELFGGALDDSGSIVFEYVGNAIKGFVGELDILFEALKNSKIISNFKDSLLGLRAVDIISLFNFSALAIAMTHAQQILKGFFADFKSLSGVARQFSVANILGLTPVLNAVRQTLFEMQGVLKAKALLNIAEAIAAMAGAMLLLSTIDPGDMTKAMIALAIMGGILESLAQTVSFSFNNLNTASLIAAVAIFSTMGTAFLKLSFALKLMSTMSGPELAVAIGGLASSVGAMVAILEVIAHLPEGTVLQGERVIKSIGACMLGISIAMKIMSSISADQMAVAIRGFLDVVIGLALIIAVLGSFPSASAVAVSANMFASLGGTFVLIAASLKILSTIPMGEPLTAALSSLLAIVVGISALMIVLTDMPKVNVAASTGMFLSMSLLFTTVALSLKVLSSMNLSEAEIAVGSLISVIAALSGAMIILSKPGRGGNAAATTQMLVLAQAIAVLAVSLKVLSTIPITSGATGLLIMAGALTIFGVAAELLPIRKMNQLSNSLLKFSLGMLAVGASFSLAGLGILSITVAFIELATFLNESTADIMEVFIILGNGIAKFILTVATTIADNAAKFTDAGIKLLISLLNGIETLLPELIEFGVKIIVALLEGVAGGAGQIAAAGLSIVTNLILGIASGIGALINAGVQLVVMFISGVADAIRTNRHMIWNAVVDLMSTLGVLILEGLAEIVSHVPIFGEDMAKGLRDAAADLEAAADEASSAIYDEFDEKNGDIVNGTGKTLAELKEMISGSASELGAASEGAGSTITNGFVSTLGIDSALLEDLNITADNFESMIPVLSSLSGKSGDEIKSSFKEYTANLPDIAKDVSQEAADNMEAVDYETPGEDNATEYAEGIDNDAYKAEDSASDMAENAADSAEGEAWRAQGAGGSLSDNYSSGIDTHAGDDDGYWIVANTIAEMEGQDYRAEYVGENLVQGLINGMQKLADDAYSLANTIASGTAYAMEVGAVVQSPSKLTTQTGRYITMGLIKGMKSLENESISSAEGIGRNTALAMSGFASLVDSIDWNANPTITPVLDTSLVESGLNDLDGLFTTSQARQAGWAAGNYTIGAIPVSNNQNGNTNNVTVMLNYDASADANELVMGIARALRTNVLMEG